MFRNRKTSQKPGEELISKFRESFPEICPDNSPPKTLDEKAPMLADTLVSQALPHRVTMDGEDRKNTDINEITPKGLQEQWGLTPSLMDPNSFAFTSFASQPPAYYTTATPGATANALGISGGVTHAGDMRTPGMPMNLLTPLSIPHTAGNHESSAMAHTSMAVDMAFNPNHAFNSLNSQGVDAFGQHNLFAPPSFLHRDPDFTILDHPAPDTQPTLGSLHLNNSSISLVSEHGSSGKFDNIRAYSRENFRFHATLRAATAMIKDPDEIPITYLNKGQAYTLTVADSDPLKSGSKPLRYRTFIRVSFEDDEQRSKPAACWQLWKEGRGANEAHQRNGKLLAVEYVDPNQGGDGEPRNSQIQLEHAAFDGFAVTWTPNRLTGNPEVAISVRFNFLSTDFSHSKGVKGIPVRLCAKTEVVSTSNSDLPVGDAPEVCYCKVKLFRDHGAERKLSNDVAHVKKLMEKYKQQIAQAEMGSAHLDKRKRSGSISSKPAKALKHKRAWSISEAGRPTSLEEDLQMKLENLKDMFSSTRPVSLLDLKGDPQDDPDLYPVQFDTGDDGSSSQMAWESSQQNAEGDMSPATSHNSFASSHHSLDLKRPNSHRSGAFDASRHDSLEWSASQQGSENGYSGMRHGRFLNHPVKIQRVPGTGTNSNPGDAWFEAMDVDAEYQPPTEVPRKPRCCFYIRPQSVSANKTNGYYRAVYLFERTAQNLAHEVSKKCQFDPTSIVRVVCNRANGINIVLDDDVVQQIPEGQDMVVEFSEISDDSKETGDRSSPSPTSVSGLEMRLIF
ncbi:hypothetical protein VTO42DRAFT_5358 [Malbranchea cinnamomea]